MIRRLIVVSLTAAALSILGPGGLCAFPANAGTGAEETPSRTSIAVRSSLGTSWGTANEHEARGALSLSKLFLVDYALRHGDGSATDRDLGERMIRFSDDGAASAMEGKYPQAIDAIAAEYGLTATRSGTGDWSTAITSSADVADFLHAKQLRDAGSPIFTWMATAGDTAADGTVQDWGTARVPGVLGTKWGWSDLGAPEVASASYGTGFAVVALTRGTPEDQTADVLGALPNVVIDVLGVPAWLVPR
ncbi:hypothetical protein [Nocardia lijiangensis]|uniref:hypothetical protein n=1 Tax=Nocardia lijiangensis TaxID=299618 RepID=UPI003D75AB79